MVRTTLDHKIASIEGFAVIQLVSDHLPGLRRQGGAVRTSNKHHAFDDE